MLLLDVRNLTIEFITSNGIFTAVDHVNFALAEGEIKGLIGESGSGKSLIAQAICGVTRPNCRISADRFHFNNIDLLKLTPRQRRRVIGENISLIFQDPDKSLDPSATIGKQLKETIRSSTYKGKWWKRWGWRQRRAIELLHRVGIKDHKEIMRHHPSELSEGESQKVMVAIALANQPRLLIADEPTDAMEASTQAQIFRLLYRMNQNQDTSVLLISHDLQIVSNWVENIQIMYSGCIIESGPTEEVISAPHHPYTQALINALPAFNQNPPFKSHLNTLPGMPPSMEQLPLGCHLGPRCQYAGKKCIVTPPMQKHRNRMFLCHFPLNMEDNP